MEASGKSNLKKVSLELGGKSPNIIFPDADLDSAVTWSSMGIFFNHGQCCCAGSRVYVHESIYDAFIKKFQEVASKIQIGDPLNPTTTHGPLVDEIQFKRVLGLLKMERRQELKLNLEVRNLTVKDTSFLLRFLRMSRMTCRLLNRKFLDLLLVL